MKSIVLTTIAASLIGTSMTTEQEQPVLHTSPAHKTKTEVSNGHIKPVTVQSKSLLPSKVNLGPVIQRGKKEKHVDTLYVTLGEVLVERYREPLINVEPRTSCYFTTCYCSFPTVTTSVIAEEPEPTETPLEILHLKFYPNPTKDHVTIEVKDPATLYLFDMSGKKLREEQFEGNTVLSLLDYPTGTYLIKCLVNGQWLSGKVIKS
jgi:hypothetical protein